jgi:hypothetical protein
LITRIDLDAFGSAISSDIRAMSVNVLSSAHLPEQSLLVDITFGEARLHALSFRAQNTRCFLKQKRRQMNDWRSEWDLILHHRRSEYSQLSEIQSGDINVSQSRKATVSYST